ncbi:MAG: glycosyltransferase [Myxococcota bacterium]
MNEIHLGARSFDRFEPLLSAERYAQTLRAAAAIQLRMRGRVLWNVNSSAVGGGVAEMLRPLLAYSRGMGVDARWLVIRGDAEFFRVTKRLHHALHGSRGDGSALGEDERRIYEDTLRDNAVELLGHVQPRDVVLLHDPQTAGLAPHLTRAGAIQVWRCHIGHDATNEEVERGWQFLRPYLSEIPAFVFSREAYVPIFCDHGKASVIQPSIDPFSPKNQELDEATVRAILVGAGLLDGPLPDATPPIFEREDGTPGRVEQHAEVIRLGRPPSWETPLVVQISRWDPLKDFLGVMRGFAGVVDGGAPAGAELILAGPDVRAVADDPEGREVFDAVVEAWRALPEVVRDRIHLVSLPTDDVDANAAIVNALQRHAAIVVQKSLQEGFGLTVTEAMWKGRAVVASAVGGIQDQIESGVQGLLIKDPTDLDAFAAAVRRLLGDADLADRLGAAARERVREQFLGVRHLLEYAHLIERLDDASAPDEGS